MIPETALMRLLYLAAARQPDEARRYLGHILPKGTPLAPLREMIAVTFSPDFARAIVEALPWLADERFAREGRSGDVRAMLEAAGSVGIARGELDAEQLEALADEVVEFDQPTGGRPRRMVRLKTHDARFNLFARQ